MDVEIGNRGDLPRRVGRGIPMAQGDASVRRFAGGMEAETQAYADILRRRFGLIRGVFLAVVTLALLYTFLQDPVYRATALVEIRGGDSQIPSVDRLFADGEPSEEQLRTHLGLLRSSSLATRVVEDLRLDTLEDFNPDGDAVQQAIVQGFLERLVVDPVEESRLVRVSFDAGTPELSARIVNAILDSYASLSVGARERAAQRLALQVDSVERRLEQAEEKLRGYANANDLPYSPEEDLTAQIAERMRDLRQQLADAEAVRRESESRYDVVVRDGRTDLVDDAIRHELELRLSELRRDYARLSATFTDEYPATTDLRRQIEHLNDLIEEEEARIAEGVESDYRLALQRERKMSEAIADMQERANRLGPQSGTYHVLRQAVLANRTLYATLHEKQREAEIAAAIGSTGLEIVDRAVPPTEPHGPVFAMSLGLAMMLGLVLGVAAAFVKELLDDTVQTAEDLPVTGQVPVLAMIPSIGSPEDQATLLAESARRAGGMLPWPSYQEAERRRARTARRRRRWPTIEMVDERDPAAHALADAFGALRTAVLFEEDEAVPRSILVSSCRAGEGKTTVSVNLAISLARLGHRVLLIDGDMRRPAVHQALRVRGKPGFADYLSKEVAWQAAVRRSVIERLDVLPSGGPTTRAGDLLSRGGLDGLLHEARERYAFVIVDAPALFINAADAKLLSRDVDGVVAVVRSRSTPRSLVDRIPHAVPKLIGVVVNDLRQSSLPDYFGDYFAYGEPGDGQSAPDGDQTAGTGVAAAFQRITNWIYSEA